MLVERRVGDERQGAGVAALWPALGGRDVTSAPGSRLSTSYGPIASSAVMRS